MLSKQIQPQRQELGGLSADGSLSTIMYPKSQPIAHLRKLALSFDCSGPQRQGQQHPAALESDKKADLLTTFLQFGD